MAYVAKNPNKWVWRWEVWSDGGYFLNVFSSKRAAKKYVKKLARRAKYNPVEHVVK